MMMKGPCFSLAALASLVSLVSLAHAAPVIEVHYTMGTYFSIRIDGMDETPARAAMRQCFSAARRLEAVFSRYDPTSELSRLNAADNGAPQPLSRDMAELLRRSLALRDATGGAFDVGIGAVAALWRHSTVWPGADVVRDADARRDRVYLGSDGRLRMEPGARLDFDGIAKGYAVDRCIALLRAAGVLRALVDLGESSQYALGAPEGREGWKLTVRGADPSQAIGTVCLRDRALSVSATFGHRRQLGGHRIGHIVDPATGMPLRKNAAALVVAESATDAEAHSKAVLIWCGGEAGYTAPACRRERAAVPAGLYLEGAQVGGWNTDAIHFRRYAHARPIRAAEEPIR